MPTDKLIILHHGAFGDLLCAWPALLALSTAFAELPRYALLKRNLSFFTQPLGYQPCPRGLSDEEQAFHGGILPPEAQDAKLFRFCLDSTPKRIPPGAHCLRALPEQEIPVTQALLTQLAELGLPSPDMEESKTLFQLLFG